MEALQIRKKLFVFEGVDQGSVVGVSVGIVAIVFVTRDADADLATDAAGFGFG